MEKNRYFWFEIEGPLFSLSKRTVGCRVFLDFGEILVLVLCFFFVFGGAMLPRLARHLGEREEESENTESKKQPKDLDEA